MATFKGMIYTGIEHVDVPCPKSQNSLKHTLKRGAS
jgi:hypothetical protein